MTKQVIAIDIDDVVADTTDALRILVNERTGANLTTEHYHNIGGGDYWSYYERVWATHGLAEQINFDDFAAEMIVDQSTVPLLPGAEFALHELSNKFHIVFITARDKAWEAATRQWFIDHFEKDDLELYFCELRTNAKAKTKGQLCKELGAEYLIDDNVDHCRSAINEGVEPILFGRYGW